MYEARKQTFSRRLDKIDFPKPQSRQLPQAPPPRSSSGHCTFASVLKLEMLSMEDLVRNNAKQLWTSCATSSIGTFLVGGKVLAKAEEMKKEIFSTVHTDKEILADRCIVPKRVVIILKSNVQVADPREKKASPPLNANKKRQEHLNSHTSTHHIPQHNPQIRLLPQGVPLTIPLPINLSTQ